VVSQNRALMIRSRDRVVFMPTSIDVREAAGV